MKESRDAFSSCLTVNRLKITLKEQVINLMFCLEVCLSEGTIFSIMEEGDFQSFSLFQRLDLEPLQDSRLSL